MLSDRSGLLPGAPNVFLLQEFVGLGRPWHPGKKPPSVRELLTPLSSYKNPTHLSQNGRNVHHSSPPLELMRICEFFQCHAASSEHLRAVSSSEPHAASEFCTTKYQKLKQQRMLLLDRARLGGPCPPRCEHNSRPRVFVNCKTV